METFSLQKTDLFEHIAINVMLKKRFPFPIHLIYLFIDWLSKNIIIRITLLKSRISSRKNQNKCSFAWRSLLLYIILTFLMYWRQSNGSCKTFILTTNDAHLNNRTSLMSETQNYQASFKIQAAILIQLFSEFWKE